MLFFVPWKLRFLLPVYMLFIFFTFTIADVLGMEGGQSPFSTNLAGCKRVPQETDLCVQRSISSKEGQE